jgi:hypothetical protein
MSNSLPIGGGFTSSPNSPDYIDISSKDLLQERTNNTIPQGSPGNRGVILTKDSLDVPLEFAFGITDDRSEPGRPTLLPLFRTLIVDDQKIPDTSRNYYEKLRNELSPNLKTKLEQDEQQPFEDRDPDLVALDNSLRFNANVLALAKSFSLPVEEGHLSLIGAQQYLNLPNAIRQEILTYGTTVSNYVDRFLAQIGPNDPSYDFLLNATNQIKQTLDLLTEFHTNPLPEAG